MKLWGILVLGAATTIATACGSSDDDDKSAGGTSGKGGKGGASGGGAGRAGRAGSSAQAEGGAAGDATGGTGGKGGSSHGGSGGTHTTGGTGGKGGATASGGAGNATSSGGASAKGGTGGQGGTGTQGGTGAQGGTLETGGAGAGGEANPTTVTLTVKTANGRHPISPLIYGVNSGAVACSESGAHFTLCRLGGGRWSTYNWENNASNPGGAECYQNDGVLAASDAPGVAVTSTMTEASGVGATTLVTLPILDYVSADKTGGADESCSGDVRKSGDDYLTTRFKQNVAVKGAALGSSPDTTDAYVYSNEFVEFLHATAGSAKVAFALDNEPGIWSNVHPEIHPAKPTYAEVVERNVRFATSTRDRWPTAEISGYVGYGYNDFLDLQGAPDADGNGLFIDYYLSHLKQASDGYGSRLVDYLDVHWYPEIYANNKRIIYEDATADSRRARVQAPRSLWDSNYVEDSIFTRYVTGGKSLRLVPWLEEHITAHFAGTKLAVSEWSYGGGTDVSGAVAAADALGIFGREGVELAAWAPLQADNPFILGAFRIFRNFDGAGAAFGDTSVAAESSNDELASVYASVDGADATHVVIVAINRAERTLTATLNLDDPQTFATADVYALTDASATPVAGAALAATDNGFSYEMPAYSVSVIVPKKP